MEHQGIAKIIEQSKGLLSILPKQFRFAGFLFLVVMGLAFLALSGKEISSEQSSFVSSLVWIAVGLAIFFAIYSDIKSVVRYIFQRSEPSPPAPEAKPVAAVPAPVSTPHSVIPDTIEPLRVLENYRKHLIQFCAELPLARLVELDIRDQSTLEHLYVPLQAYETVREDDPLRFRRRVIEGDYDNKVAVVDLAERENRWVLLGEPGAGKSTFARHLARAMADRTSELPEVLRDCLPVFIELRGLIKFWPEDSRGANVPALWQALQQDLTLNHGFPAEQAGAMVQALQSEQDPQLWILDGLDEVTASAGRRESLCRTIEQLVAKKRRVLVTARPYAYADSAWRLQGFNVYALAPFEQEQWTQFINQYYHGLQQSYGLALKEAEELAQRLIEDLGAQQRPHMLRLAQRPLLLTLLTHQHAKGRGRLPDSRAELYENSVQQLLSKWQQARLEVFRDDKHAEERRMLDLLDVDLATLREHLQELAFECHRQQQEGKRGDDTADISRRDLIGLFEDLMNKREGYQPKLIVDFLQDQTSLLYARNSQTFAFAHRTFQEYLAACYLTDSGALDERELLLQTVSDLPWWREVVLLAVGKARAGGTSAALNAIAQLLPHSVDEACDQPTGLDERDGYAAMLAGYALDEQSRQGDISRNQKFQRLQSRCVGWLRHLLDEGLLTPAERAEAGDVLGMLGDPRPGVGAVPTEQGELPAMAFAYVPGTENFYLGYTVNELRNWDKERLGFEPDENEHWPEAQPSLSIPAFWMAAYPVTVAQFKPFVDANAYENKNYWTDSGVDWLKEKKQTAPLDWEKQLKYPNRPVTIVTWYESVAYCNWLNTKLEALLGKNKIKIFLPSEYEWEWAARGPERRHYPWGETWQEGYANVEEATINRACTVGIFPDNVNWLDATSQSLPEPFLTSKHVYDLSGNVWEWCRTKVQNSYENYQTDKNVWDGRYLRGDGGRIVRGNSYYNNGLAARGALRDGPRPGGWNDVRGFRCCAHVILDSDC